MHPVDLIAASIPIDDPDRPVMPGDIESGICAVTGQLCSTIQRDLLLGKSFTDGSLLAAPGSDRVGLNAYLALKYKWERMSSWICDGKTFSRLDRQGVRSAVFSKSPELPWCSYATTSYKKHGSLRTPINSGGQRIWLFESRLVDCTDFQKMMEIWDRLNIELRRGFGRSILESADCPVYLIQKIGMREWIDFERWATPIKNSSLYAFMCYLLPSQEELKNEKNRQDS